MQFTAMDQTAVDLACETLYRFLAAAIRDPGLDSGGLLIAADCQQLAAEACDLLRSEFGDTAIPLGFGELPVEELNLRPAINALAASLFEGREEYTRVFGLTACRECPPYETEYHKAEEVFFRSQQMADIAGFYQAFGLAPGGASRERPDHLAVELEFVAYLLMKQRLANEADRGAEPAATCQRAREVFFRDHLAWWVPSFSVGLRRKAETGFYAGIGRVLGALLPIERHRYGILPPIMPLEADFIESPEETDGCMTPIEV